MWYSNHLDLCQTASPRKRARHIISAMGNQIPDGLTFSSFKNCFYIRDVLSPFPSLGFLLFNSFFYLVFFFEIFLVCLIYTSNTFRSEHVHLCADHQSDLFRRQWKIFTIHLVVWFTQLQWNLSNRSYWCLVFQNRCKLQTMARVSCRETRWNTSTILLSEKTTSSSRVVSIRYRSMYCKLTFQIRLVADRNNRSWTKKSTERWHHCSRYSMMLFHNDSWYRDAFQSER